MPSAKRKEHSKTAFLCSAFFFSFGECFFVCHSAKRVKPIYTMDVRKVKGSGNRYSDLRKRSTSSLNCQLRLSTRASSRAGGGGGGGCQAAPGRMCLFLIYPAAVEVQKHVPLATTSVKSRTARSMHGGSLDQTRFVSMLAWQLP
jgi:hypothetical protein